jgi:hypothetical protein
LKQTELQEGRREEALLEREQEKRSEVDKMNQFEGVQKQRTLFVTQIKYLSIYIF